MAMYLVQQHNDFRQAVTELGNSTKSPKIHAQKLIFWDENMPSLVSPYILLRDIQELNRTKSIEL